MNRVCCFCDRPMRWTCRVTYGMLGILFLNYIAVLIYVISK